MDKYTGKKIINKSFHYKNPILFNTLIKNEILNPSELSSKYINIKEKHKKILKVKVPTWRPDINLEEDLIEELIRIKGFDKIKLVKPEKNRINETLNFKQKLPKISNL